MGLIVIVATTMLTMLFENVSGGDRLARAPWILVVSVATFLLVEGVLPWLHGGSTPGGSFVRMTCETREREGFGRGVFYAARLAVLGMSYCFFPFAGPLLALYYFVRRRMPYDEL